MAADMQPTLAYAYAQGDSITFAANTEGGPFGLESGNDSRNAERAGDAEHHSARNGREEVTFRWYFGLWS